MITFVVFVVEFPAASVATTVNTLGPSGKDDTDSCQAFWVTVAGMPFTVTVAAVSSWTNPCTTIGNEPSTAPGEGAALERSSGVRTSVTCNSCVLVLPAAPVATKGKRSTSSADR